MYILITLSFNFLLSHLKSIWFYWVGLPMLWHILNHQLILHFLWLGMMFQKIIITEDIFHFLNQRQPCLLWEQICHLHTFTHIDSHTHLLKYTFICRNMWTYIRFEWRNWNSLRLLEIRRKHREKENEWNVWNVTNSLFSIWFGVAVFFKNFDKIPLPF